MKKQTESLDGACSDGGYPYAPTNGRILTTTNTAVKQLSSAKRARVIATNALTSEAQTNFIGLQDGLASTSKNIQAISVQISKEVKRVSQTTAQVLTWEQTATLSSATQAYHSATAAQISTLRQATECLVEVGTREDQPTGNTPRKKMWQYQDEWELTKSRDVVLKEWRKRGPPAKDSEMFLVDDGEDDAASDGDAMMREADEVEGVEEEALAQSMASSLASSSTAASVTIRQKCLSPPPIPLPPVPVPVLKPVHHKRDGSKSGLPTMGTLTERSTNIFGGRRRLR